MPVRLVGGYFVFVGISLAATWLAVWAAYAFAGRPTPGRDRSVSELVAALDTILMVPALAIGGVLLWRHNAARSRRRGDCRGSKLALSPCSGDRPEIFGWRADLPMARRDSDVGRPGNDETARRVLLVNAFSPVEV